MSTRRRHVSLTLGVLLLGLALWLALRSTLSVTDTAAELALQPPEAPGAAGAALQAAQALSADESSSAVAAPRTAATPRLTARRQQLRERVVRTLREREQKRAAAASGPASPGAASGAEPGSLVDKTGTLTAEEMRVLNEELMPMISQCLDQAHERDPQLKGMLAVELSFASAEDLGSIVESVEPAPINELADEELLECVRQSAFTIDFPVPGADGRSDGMLTIPFGIDPADWRPRATAAEQPPVTPAMP